MEAEAAVQGGRPPYVRDRKSNDRSPIAFGPSFWPASEHRIATHSSPGRIQAGRRRQMSRIPKICIPYIKSPRDPSNEKRIEKKPA